ncbi:MAG: matrixin family metalloprotease [Nocardioides sp.]|nr:matrixin family metalloprotease [Nocardioides sp.]
MSRTRAPLVVAVTLSVLAALLAALPVSTSQAAGTKGSATWDVSSYVAGTDKLQVHGKVPGGKRQVQLQVRTKSGWQTLKSRRSTGNGSYRLASTLDWVGTHKVRVFAPGRPAFSKGTKARVSPGYDPVGTKSDFRLLGRSVAKTPRFNPCQPVTYKVNTDDVGPEALATVQAAIAQISHATGMRFKFKGSTSFIPYNGKGRPSAGADLLITWATTAEAKVFQDKDPGVAGVGGPLWGFAARDAQGRRVVRTSEAGVVFKTESYATTFTPATETRDKFKPPVGRVIMHEIGHALGLDHSPSATEIMYYTLWDADPDGVYRNRFGAGDLNGLDKVGYGQGCLRSLRGGRLVPAPMPEPQV